MLHLFRPNENAQMKFRRLVSLLKPVFAEDGFNERTYQNKLYNVFLKYLRVFSVYTGKFEGEKPFKTFHN